MLLSITSTTPPATDLGFLLHKNPANVRTVSLSFGRARVFYPEATDDRCMAVLLLEIEPTSLVRRGRRGGFALAEYVNDRPYVASSFLSVAIAKVYGTAMAGRSEDRPDLVEAPLALEAHLPVVPSRGDPALVAALFEPLGYEVVTRAISLDERFPAWGDSAYLDVRLRGATRLRDLLQHLYVLLPVLDDEKHYWVSRDEIDKLLARGAAWLATHPERELITRRYLRHQPGLAREAMARLLEEDEADPDAVAARRDRDEASMERPLELGRRRVEAVVAALLAAEPRRVLDLGCGDGRLIQALLREGAVEEIVGVDVSAAALSAAARRLRLEEMSPKQRERVRLLQGALTYRDRRLAGFDGAALMEVVEHLDPERLDAFERCVFAEAAPATVVLTTPNAEYNARFAGLLPGELRHRDHRFEWTRDGLRAWAGGVAERRGFAVRFEPVGPEDPQLGPPTQMAVFAR
jgi:3' terminal RNA ribose 2'-O-methyltransferase Hen1